MYFCKNKNMEELITIKIKDKKAKKVIESLEEIKFIQVVRDPLLGLTPKKKKQAKDFLSALKQAKLAEQGKIKLKTLDQLINEL
jgi:hypothetical protein